MRPDHREYGLENSALTWGRLHIGPSRRHSASPHRLVLQRSSGHRIHSRLLTLAGTTSPLSPFSSKMFRGHTVPPGGLRKPRVWPVWPTRRRNLSPRKILSINVLHGAQSFAPNLPSSKRVVLDRYCHSLLISIHRSHSRLHDPVPRKHQCVVCGKDFEHSKDLKRHAGIHTRIESSVSPMPSCSLEYLRPANMSRNIRFKHPGAYITSLTCSAKKDAIADNPPQDASIQESIEPQELGSPSATSQRVPASSSSPSTAVAAVDTNLKVQSPDTLDDVSESQADQREHQHSTETPIAESVLERIIDLSLKFQALEEEHRALLSIDPELLGPDDASTMSCLEEDAPLYDQDLTPPSDQSGEKGTDFSGRTSSQFDTVPGTSSGHFSGNSGGKRTQRDNDDEPDPNEEGNKRAKRPQVASETRSSSKLLFQCPERGCLATFHYLGNLM